MNIHKEHPPKSVDLRAPREWTMELVQEGVQHIAIVKCRGVRVSCARSGHRAGEKAIGGQDPIVDSGFSRRSPGERQRRRGRCAVGTSVSVIIAPVTFRRTAKVLRTACRASLARGTRSAVRAAEFRRGRRLKIGC